MLPGTRQGQHCHRQDFPWNSPPPLPKTPAKGTPARVTLSPCSEGAKHSTLPLQLQLPRLAPSLHLHSLCQHCCLTWSRDRESRDKVLSCPHQHVPSRTFQAELQGNSALSALPLHTKNTRSFSSPFLSCFKQHPGKRAASPPALTPIRLC